MLKFLLKQRVKLFAVGIALILLYKWITILQQVTMDAKKQEGTNPRKIKTLHLDIAQKRVHSPHYNQTNHPRFFLNLDDAHEYMEKMALNVPQEVVIQYRNFSIDLPNFIDEADRELFLKSALNRGNLRPTLVEQLFGRVEIVPNATFQQPFDCGFRADYDHVKRWRSPTMEFEYLAPIVVPHAFKFQHFYDGLLPKLIQAYPLLSRPEVKILIEKPEHPNINAILEKLNFTPDKFVWYTPQKRHHQEPVYYAKYMLMTCITPPLHPDLWKSVRQRLHIPESLPQDTSKTHVILLSRAGALKSGRNIINQAEIQAFLSERYSEQFIKFGDFSFDEAINTFKSVRVIIGVHGGAFYNMNYAPADSTVIEIGPTLADGRDIGLPHAIFWAMAELLEQRYWRLPTIVPGGSANVYVDLDKLRRILDVVDTQYD